MPRPALWFALTLAVLLAAGCGEVPTAAPAGPGPATPPGPTGYPPPPTVPTETPMPTRTRVPPIPTPTPIQPTPYAPAEALPADFPTVVYAVHRPIAPDQPWPGRSVMPVQLWQLRYEGGLLLEELWFDLDPSAAVDENDLRSRDVGRGWVKQLTTSPDGRYVALLLHSWDTGIRTWIINTQDRSWDIPSLDISGQYQPVGFMAWIPGRDRLFAGTSDGYVPGTIRVDGSDFIGFPDYLSSFNGLLDAVVTSDGKTVIFSRMPSLADSTFLGSVYLDSGERTALALPETLHASLIRTGYIRNLALSPDGRICAFTAEHAVTNEGSGQIWLMEVDGSGFRPLGPDNTYDYGLAWSPDGRTIAFARWDDPGPIGPIYNPATPLVGSLMLIDVATGQERVLLPSEGRYAHWSPHWLPDGSGLLFLSDRGGQANLWFIRPDGTGLQQLTYQGGLTGEIALLGK